MMNAKWCGCTCAKIGKVLLLIGGLNWGLVGVGMLMGSDWNVVTMLVGSMPTLEAVVYVLVGVAAVMACFGCKCTICKSCCGSCDTGGHESDQNM